jgi:hypothetical protein
MNESTKKPMLQMVLAALATTAILLLGVTPTVSQNQSARKLYVFQAKVAQAERQCWTVGGFVRCVDGSDDDEIGLYVVRDILSKCPSTITITDSKQDASYLLKPHYKASALYDNTNGDVLYVSPANHTGNIAKDICRFVATKNK